MQALSQLSYTPGASLKETRAVRPVFDYPLAEWTGLEPATPGVTGRYSNQLNYHSTRSCFAPLRAKRSQTWRPYGDSNPGTHRERVMS